MATKTTTLTCANFSLTSSYKCKEIYNDNNSSGIPDGYTTTTASTASVTKTFAFALPPDASNVSAVLTVTTGEGAWSTAVNTINGTSVGSNTTATISIPVTATTSVVQIPFVYQCVNTLHKTHGVETYSHSSVMSYSNISLTVTYDSDMTAATAIEKTGSTSATNSQILLTKTTSNGQAWSFTISGIPSGAVVTSATLTFTGSNSYAAPGTTRVYWGSSIDGTNIYWKSGGLYGESASVDLTSYISGNGTYSLYFYKTSVNTTTQSYVAFNNITVTVNYTYYAYPPTSPTTVLINNASSAYVAQNGSATLSWSGASGGTNNDLTGYNIYVNGSLYSSQGTGISSLSIPAYTGGTYTWTVRAQATHSEGADSTGVYCYTYNAPGAPTSVAVDPSSTIPNGKAELSWSGATDGVHNQITGYHVYYSTSSDGEKTFFYSTTETACEVTAPSTVNSSYYYWVYTLGEREWNSEASSTYGTLTCTYTDPTAPTLLVLSNIISQGEEATLSWSGATDGAGNAIKEYSVYVQYSTDGSTWGEKELCGSATSPSVSCSVSPHSDVGGYALFTVRSVGTVSDTYSDYSTAAATMYHFGSFTDPTITAGETYIRAVHMTELQAVINNLRKCCGLSDATFTTVTSGETSLAGWTDHVNELRTAIDDTGISHDAWIEFSVNCPRADVMTQLRNVILNA